MKYEISIIFTLYNRGFEIKEAIQKISSFLAENNITHEFIVCNDGSTDNTLSICDSINKKYDNLKILSYKKNRGRGYAVKFSTKHCSGNNILFLDSDIIKTTPLNNLLDAIRSFQHNKIIIANRFSSKNPYGRKKTRKIISFFQHLITIIIFPEIFKIKDTEAGFKGARSDIFKKILQQTHEEHWGLDLEFIILAKKNKLPIHQLPIEWNENYNNYFSTVNILKDSINQLKSILRIRRKTLLRSNKIKTD